MAKLTKPEDFGKLIAKRQGNESDVAFAKTLDITRQSLRALKLGKYLPKSEILKKFGLEMVYRAISPPAKPKKAVKAVKR